MTLKRGRARALGSREPANDAPAHQQAQGAAGERKRQAFGQQLAEEPGAPGAQRAADRHFLLPGHGAGKQQVGHVGAGDQQHQAHRGKHQDQRIARLADQVVVQRHHYGTDLVIRIGIALLEAAGDRAEVGQSGLRRHARLQPSDGIGPMAAAVPKTLGAHIEGDPELRLGGKAERGRHDADDGVFLRVQLDGFAHGVRIAGEAAAPQGVPQNRHLVLPGLVFTGASRSCRGAAARRAGRRSSPR